MYADTDICGCSCSGCRCEEIGGRSLERRYQTKAERRSDLESYLSDLKKELQAVEEHLAAFENA